MAQEVMVITALLPVDVEAGVPGGGYAYSSGGNATAAKESGTASYFDCVDVPVMVVVVILLLRYVMMLL
jgi:hypothetical protein